MSLITNLNNYYKFTESSGSAVDQVSSLTLANTSVTYGAGLIDNCAICNGSASLQSSSNIGITGNSARSINLWIKYSSTTGDGLVSFGSTVANGNMFSVLISSNKLFFGGNSADVSGSGSALNDNAWHMLTVTYDGTTVQLYTDATAGNSGTPGLSTTASHLFIGSRIGGTSNFTGNIDEVGIWTRVLTSGEVTTLYRNGLGFQYPFFSVVPTVGVFTLTGISANLIKPVYNLHVLVGQFIITGIDAIFKARPRIWTNISKNTDTFSNQSKNSSSFSNQAKSTTVWSEESKS